MTEKSVCVLYRTSFVERFVIRHERYVCSRVYIYIYIYYSFAPPQTFRGA